jgi:hypothetical protein
MTAEHWADLSSAGLGAAGTIILFINSWSLQSRPGLYPASKEVKDAVNDKNVSRTNWQRIGLVLLCLSFAGQAIAVFLA